MCPCVLSLPIGSVGHMVVALGPIDLRLDGRPAPSATSMRAESPHVVVLTTALTELGLTVLSTYVGADDVDTTVVHVALGRRPSARRDVRNIARDALPVTHAREQCLLDHLAHVREVVEEATGSSTTLDIAEAALGAAR